MFTIFGSFFTNNRNKKKIKMIKLASELCSYHLKNNTKATEKPVHSVRYKEQN